MNNFEQAMALLEEANKKSGRRSGATKLDSIYKILEEADAPMTKREIVNKATFAQIEALYGEDLDLEGNEEQREALIAASVKLSKTVGTAVSHSNNSAAIDYNEKYEMTVKSERIDGQTKYSLTPKGSVEESDEVSEEV